MTLDEVVAQTQEKAREIARREEHQPIVMLVHGDVVTPVWLQGGLPRDILPLVLERQQPDAYVLVVEARLRAGGQPAYDGEIANNPQNPEALVIVASPRGGPARSWMANIWPAQRGEREVGVWQDPETMELDFAGLLVIENW